MVGQALPDKIQPDRSQMSGKAMTYMSRFAAADR